MTNYFIYSGLGIILFGSVIGLLAAIKGFALNDYKFDLIEKPNPAIKEKIQKYTKPALYFLIIGAVILTIGIGLGLSS